MSKLLYILILIHEEFRETKVYLPTFAVAVAIVVVAGHIQTPSFLGLVCKKWLARIGST